jgi:hypothetical protein
LLLLLEICLVSLCFCNIFTVSASQLCCLPSCRYYFVSECVPVGCLLL